MEKILKYFQKSIDKYGSICYNVNVNNGHPNCNTAYCKSYNKHNCAVDRLERQAQIKN